MRIRQAGINGVVGLLLLVAVQAFAHGNVRCPSLPQTEWQSQDQLQKKLISEGWQVRKIEVSKSCYEVYAKDAQGKKVEAFFNPQTLERVQK